MTIQSTTNWLTVACICLAAPVVADEPPGDVITVEKPFLWRIEPQTAGGKPSWLFGTIHVPDKSITTLHPVTQAAFDQSDAAYFEVDEMQDVAAQIKAISLPDGQTLENLIDAELVERLDARLRKISPLISREQLPDAHIAVWPLLLGNLEAQVRYLGEPPLDASLYFAARNAGKQVGGLESPRQQLTGIIELPLEDQITFLRAALDGMDDDEASGVKRLQETILKYASGDPKEFDGYLESEMKRIGLPDELSRRILTALLRDRNQRMAESIARLTQDSRDKTFFFAVGVAHLTGNDSVQDFLNRKGYTITGPHTRLKN